MFNKQKTHEMRGSEYARSAFEFAKQRGSYNSETDAHKLGDNLIDDIDMTVMGTHNRPEINTLNDAELHFRRSGVVKADGVSEFITEEDVMRVCGYTNTNTTDWRKKQIEKHNFKEGVDFGFISPRANKPQGGRPTKNCQFTVRASNHILLAAMTPEGKEARDEAIDLKVQQNLVELDERGVPLWLLEEKRKTEAALIDAYARIGTTNKRIDRVEDVLVNEFAPAIESKLTKHDADSRYVRINEGIPDGYKNITNYCDELFTTRTDEGRKVSGSKYHINTKKLAEIFEYRGIKFKTSISRYGREMKLYRVDDVTPLMLEIVNGMVFDRTTKHSGNKIFINKEADLEVSLTPDVNGNISLSYSTASPLDAWFD